MCPKCGSTNISDEACDFNPFGRYRYCADCGYGGSWYLFDLSTPDRFFIDGGKRRRLRLKLEDNLQK